MTPPSTGGQPTETPSSGTGGQTGTGSQPTGTPASSQTGGQTGGGTPGLPHSGAATSATSILDSLGVLLILAGGLLALGLLLVRRATRPARQ
jgi:hypothetical protein